MDQGKPVSRKHAVIGGVLGTLLVLALLAGLGWFGYTLFNQPIPSASSASGDKGNSSNNPSRNPSAAQGREAARVRAAEKVPLADISDGKPNQKSARLDRGPSPVDLGKASDGPAAARLPEVVNLDGLNAGNPPPPRVAPVDLRGLAAGTKPSGVSPVNIGQDGGKAAVRLPAVVKLGDLNTGKPPPANLRPVDLGSMATESHVGGVPTANVGQAGADSSAPRLPNLVNLDGLAGGSAAKSPSMHPANVEASKGKGDFSAWQAAEQKSLDQQMAKLASDPDLMDAGEKARRFATCICRDLQGRLWLGCEPHSEDPHDGGAWCYDPSLPKDKQWKQYTAADGLGDNYVYAIACDKKGRIWVGQLNHGLSVYNGQKWQCYEVVGGLSRPDTLSGPIGERIFHITVDPSGNVWACTSAGLCEYIDARNTWRYFTRAEGLPSDQANSLAFDAEGNIYVATQCDGIAMAKAADDYKIWRTVSGPEREPTEPQGKGLPTCLINDILVTADGTIYAATDVGLAWSEDRGQSWRFTRGLDWAEKVRNLYGGPPKEWKETPGAILAEDYCTCLADANGILYVGHRQRSLESVDVRSGHTAAIGPAGFTSAVVADPKTEIAFYGKGIVFRGESPLMGKGPGKTALSPAAVPSGAPAPTMQELRQLVTATHSAAQRAKMAAEFEGDDWSTQGDWVGRVGRQRASLCAADSPFDHEFVPGWGHYVIKAKIGPNAPPHDGLRNWIGALDTDDPRSLWDPVVGHRRQASWDDRGEAYAQSADGPNIQVHVEVPAGLHRVSFYFTEGSALRDYLVELTDDPASSDVLAHCRVRDFSAGVYKIFQVMGPRSFDVRILRNHSHNTICSGVMIDVIGDSPFAQEGMLLPFMGDIRYDPPRLDEYTLPLPMLDWLEIWRAINPPEPSALPSLSQRYSNIMCYRAAAHSNVTPDVLLNWRWNLLLWSKQDRIDFQRTMVAAWESIVEQNPDLQRLHDQKHSQ